MGNITEVRSFFQNPVFSTGNVVLDFTTGDAGDYCFAFMHTKPHTATTTTPAGWTLLHSRASATGIATGADVGDTLIEVFGRELTAAGVSTTFVNASNSVSGGQTAIFRKDVLSDAWVAPSIVSGADNTADNFFSVSFGTPQRGPEDAWVIVWSIPTDAYTSGFYDQHTNVQNYSYRDPTYNASKSAVGNDIGLGLTANKPTINDSSTLQINSSTLTGGASRAYGPAVYVRMRATAPSGGGGGAGGRVRNVRSSNPARARASTW